MINSDLADEIIKRLNLLINDPNIKNDIEKLINTRIKVSSETCNHSTIQVDVGSLGFLGLLNGIVGTLEHGSKQGWGYISAEFDDDGKLVKFCKTI
jgi:hypothetical protein